LNFSPLTFSLVGYNYEARVFDEMEELINHLKKENKEKVKAPYW
jgi:hypothetical protein